MVIFSEERNATYKQIVKEIEKFHLEFLLHDNVVKKSPKSCQKTFSLVILTNQSDDGDKAHASFPELVNSFNSSSNWFIRSANLVDVD